MGWYCVGHFGLRPVVVKCSNIAWQHSTNWWIHLVFPSWFPTVRDQDLLPADLFSLISHYIPSYIPLTSMKRPLNVQLAAVSNLAVTLKRSAGENSHIASTAISWSRHGNPLPKFPEALTQRHSSSLSVSTEQCSSFPCWLMISSGIVLPFIYPIRSMYGIYANIWVYWW